MENNESEDDSPQFSQYSCGPSWQDQFWNNQYHRRQGYHQQEQEEAYRQHRQQERNPQQEDRTEQPQDLRYILD